MCLQIIGPKQDDDEKEIQENELVGDEIGDGDGTEQDKEGKGLFRMVEKVVLEGFQAAPRQDLLDLNVTIHYLYWNIYQVCTANINGCSYLQRNRQPGGCSGYRTRHYREQADGNLTYRWGKPLSRIYIPPFTQAKTTSTELLPPRCPVGGKHADVCPRELFRGLFSHLLI